VIRIFFASALPLTGCCVLVIPWEISDDREARRAGDESHVYIIAVQKRAAQLSPTGKEDKAGPSEWHVHGL
jgi:hypothetical protein